MPTIISRAQAKKLGKTRYFTGEPCKNGHIAERYTKGCMCVTCVKIHVDSIDIEKKREYKRNHYGNKRKRTDRNIGTATPKWADKDAIRAIYIEAVDMTMRTGIQHEVDHIVPLNGDDVCGLHVENNLRVVTKDVNRSKGNRLHQ